jgi:hypothetical protein
MRERAYAFLLLLLCCVSLCVHLPALPAVPATVQVYVAPGHVDDDLVRSISLPAQHPNAPEVFYRVITAQGEAMNRLLDKLDDMPLFLLWGSKVRLGWWGDWRRAWCAVLVRKHGHGGLMTGR